MSLVEPREQMFFKSVINDSFVIHFGSHKENSEGEYPFLEWGSKFVDIHFCDFSCAGMFKYWLVESDGDYYEIKDSSILKKEYGEIERVFLSSSILLPQSSGDGRRWQNIAMLQILLKDNETDLNCPICSYSFGSYQHEIGSKNLTYNEDEYYQSINKCHSLKPNLDVLGDGFAFKIEPYRIFSNSLGFRDFEHSQNLSNAKVAFIGDSFTYGQGVNFEDTFYYHLNSRFSVEFPGRFEFFNFGIPGHDIEEHGTTFNCFVDQLNPKYVVLVLLSDDVSPPLASYISKYMDLSKYNWSDPDSHEEYIKAVLKGVRDRLKDVSKKQDEFLLDYSHIFSDINAKSNLIVVTFPLGSQKQREYFEDFFDEMRIPFFEMKDYYQIDNPEDLDLLPGLDGHPSKKGHQRVVEILYPFLKGELV